MLMIAALDGLQDEAAEIMGDGDMALDFVYGLVGLVEIVPEMENESRKAWRESEKGKYLE